ncbi:exodeoxyribonuclease I [Pseudomonas luteola]
MKHWYDLETSDAFHSTQALQCAGLTTDDDLNIIKGSEFNLIAKPRLDVIPSPMAFMVHMLDIDHLKTEGLTERQLLKHMERIFLYSKNSQICGYNSMKFDDIVTRHSFFRNMMPPYNHEWKEGNTRYDAFKLVQFVHALRPDLLVFPKKEDGSDSLKLESLSKANGIIHERAHDAVSDVYATVDLVRMIKERSPRLYQYTQSLTNKANNEDLALFGGPLLHVHFAYGKENRNSSLIYPLARDQSNKNKFLHIDLRQDPYHMLNMSPEEIKHYLFTKRGELPDGAPVVPVGSFQINDMPLIVKPKGILTPELASSNNLDLDQCMRHLEMIKNSRDLLSRIQQAFRYPEKTPSHVFDTLYSGGFFSRKDEGARQILAAMPDEKLKVTDVIEFCQKTDDKLRMLELLTAMKSEAGGDLSPIEMAILHRQLKFNFFDSESNMSFDKFDRSVQEIRLSRDLSEEQEIVMQKLMSHVGGIQHRFLMLEEKVNSLAVEIDQEIDRLGHKWLKDYLVSDKPNGVMPPLTRTAEPTQAISDIPAP